MSRRPRLTSELRERLIKILVDEGCQCEEQHDFYEDSHSLNCLASCALGEIDHLEARVKELEQRG